jgi:hypothetical protein
MTKLIVAFRNFTKAPKKELWEIIITLKNIISPWKDVISSDLVKYGDVKFGEETHVLIEIIWTSERCQSNGILR